MNERKLNQKECLDCGKKVNITKTNYCPSCGRELFIPVIEKKWSYKVIAGIVITVILLYVIYLLVSPVLYYNLDKV